MPGAVSDYLLSVPERVLRSASALAAGLLRETSDVAIPAFLRKSRLYQILVDSTLRFLIEQVGQVEGTYPDQEQLAQDFLLRRTAGNGIELLGILTFRASPVWVMAALADVSGAGRLLIRQVASELQRARLLDAQENFDTVDQVLDGLERASARIATTVNSPPLDVASLRAELAAIRSELASIPAPSLPSPETVWDSWSSLQQEARSQNRTVFELSTILALSAVTRLPENLRWLGKSAALAARRAGGMFAEALLGHYRDALGEIHRTGHVRYWSREFRPYLRAAALQFSPRRRSLSQRWLRGGTALLLLFSLAAWGAGPRVAPADLKAHVEFLASDLLEGRATASRGLDLAAVYIAAQFRRAGLAPQPDGTYFQAVSPGHRNIVGVLEGSHPHLRSTYLLVTAHYDHLGSIEGEGDTVYNGANDNASGVATIIEIARTLSQGDRPARSLVFLAFFGEERRMLGSRHYAAHPLFPIEATLAQLNFEQTGRTDDLEGTNARVLDLTGFDYTDIAPVLQSAAEPFGVTIAKRIPWSDTAFRRSDNEALAGRGVPAHTLSASYNFPDYHQVGDSWDKLDYENMAAVTEAAAAGVRALANRTQPVKWLKPVPPPARTKARKPAPGPSKAPSSASPEP